METRNFFGSNGLSSSSAAHVAELARQFAKTQQTVLNATSFVSESIKLIGTNEREIISIGMREPHIPTLGESLRLIGQCNSLIAFLMEAIKERDKAYKEAKNWENKDGREWAAKAREELKKPVLEPTITEEDVIRCWSIGTLEHYLTLQAHASVIGKYVHENGMLDNARAEMSHALEHPIKVSDTGRDTIIREFTLSAERNVVDTFYFDLQAKHHSLQSELNGMKKSIKDAIEKDEFAKQEAYRRAQQEYFAKEKDIERELQAIYAGEERARRSLLEEVENLKIVIPNNLREIYEMVTK